MSIPPRRIVTGHDATGRPVILADGPAPQSRTLDDGATFHEIWSTAATPVPVMPVEPKEPAGGGGPIAPPANGTVVRVVDIPPGSRSPMHRTETIDYGIVLAGTVRLVLGDAEVDLAVGDIVIQRGTDHAWDNRSDAPARMLFVLLDGEFSPDLAAFVGVT